MKVQWTQLNGTAVNGISRLMTTCILNMNLYFENEHLYFLTK